ncbi:hypothetical protein vBLivaVAfA18_088 [Listeria phage vB_Liva_VAfA18]|uniref:Uncharacterized protein n=1 Tax=Listeria phage vB_Liva_VAfA18 TaxID=2712945 RepID=A0A858E9S5_9CAUD|nr:hypothetical protein vBLivaVAfA18_088 [Listeria phage vB_Liva_VAfA18]
MLPFYSIYAIIIACVIYTIIFILVVRRMYRKADKREKEKEDILNTMTEITEEIKTFIGGENNNDN